MFSGQEFQSRLNKVIAGMSDLGLDALVVIDDERRIGGGSVRYLTNYYGSISLAPAALVLTPPDVTLCLVPGFLGSSFKVAHQQSPWVKEVLGTRAGFWGADFAQDIRKALDKAKPMVRRVGFDGLDLMAETLAKKIRAAHRDVELFENTGIVERIRLVKSPSECEVIREAARLTDIGITAFMDSIKAGNPQYVSTAKAKEASKVQGAEEVIVFMGAGNPWIWGEHRGSQVYKDGDMVCFEVSAKFQGYWGQVARTCIIGNPSGKQRHIYETVMVAYREMKSMLKPGVRASELFGARNRVLIKAGYDTPGLLHGMRAGHGMGLTIAEGFDIFEGDHTVIQPGFYLEIHDMVTIPEEGQVAIGGDALLMTETGYEELNQAEYRPQV